MWTKWGLRVSSTCLEIYFEMSLCFLFFFKLQCILLPFHSNANILLRDQDIYHLNRSRVGSRGGFEKKIVLYYLYFMIMISFLVHDLGRSPERDHPDIIITEERHKIMFQGALPNMKPKLPVIDSPLPTILCTSLWQQRDNSLLSHFPQWVYYTNPFRPRQFEAYEIAPKFCVKRPAHSNIREAQSPYLPIPSHPAFPGFPFGAPSMILFNPHVWCGVSFHLTTLGLGLYNFIQYNNLIENFFLGNWS